MEKVLLNTNYPELGEPKRGKVRDIYDLGDYFWIITTDRLSAFDVILAEGIPGKGRVLNQISLMWFGMMEDIIPNHIAVDDVNERSVIVKKARPLPVECIVRGYLSGSGWKEYKKKGSVCGVKLPGGLVESSKLSEPIFTPSTKEEGGLHDRNISFDEMAAILMSTELAKKIKEISLAIYEKAWLYAMDRGIIIPDTKFEFGHENETNQFILIDELLTPDSSRFWLLKNYKPGGPQDSYDKQPIRDYLVGKGWKGAENGHAPDLPEWLIKQTSWRYQEILEILRP